MSRRILIAEDEPYIVESLSFVFGQVGYKVTTAADGETAMAAIDTERPHLVVLDLMLPKFDGFQVLKWIRENAHMTETRVMILTAKGHNQDKVRAQELGADAFVTKPFSNKDVLARVSELLAATDQEG